MYGPDVFDIVAKQYGPIYSWVSSVRTETICRCAARRRRIFASRRRCLSAACCLQAFSLFHRHLLMTSWAVVCDVWYLEPQFLKPGESPIEFADRGGPRPTVAVLGAQTC
ncbi:hypothetical protein Taro_011429 [Colocasia esculenta]|uniref:Uncharacterized protein n=1 Tax=Colocasia esculenta TaxID=4460 RepID=A0A843U651_COLES|nr:hypothetical protein [Colocasia esculenta]